MFESLSNGADGLCNASLARKSASFAAVFFFGLFLVGVFGRLSRPLMWADESVTAVGAQRVLEYGYPKVHDGKNALYDMRHPNPTLGIDPKTDAYIGGASWGHYYFAAPFVWVAAHFSDLYTKTLILRLPFAVAGTAGVLLLALLTAGFLPDTSKRPLFLAAFFLVECASVALQLHVREVRYYSLQILLSVLTILFFARHCLQGRLKYGTFFFASTASLITLFFVFAPAYFACLIIFPIFAALVPWVGQAEASLPRKRGWTIPRSTMKWSLPCLVSLLVVGPALFFFQTFHIARELAAFYGYSARAYLDNLGAIVEYFAKYDMSMALLIPSTFVLLEARRVLKIPELHEPFLLSVLLLLFILLYIALIAKIPNALFMRYFIILQPIAACMFFLDLFILQRVWAAGVATRKLSVVCPIFGCAAICLMYFHSLPLIVGRILEIRNPYFGVLDYVIPYLGRSVSKPEDLVIATNYEETSFEYYLKCKVIIGFLGNNLDKDMTARPDVILYRRGWGWQGDQGIYSYLLGRAKYASISFPVVDYPVNNIPQLYSGQTGSLAHLFQTQWSADPASQVAIFVREGLTR